MPGTFAFAALLLVPVLAVMRIRHDRAASESARRTSAGRRQPVCSEARTWNIWLFG
jgi:hypothetical protein